MGKGPEVDRRDKKGASGGWLGFARAPFLRAVAEVLGGLRSGLNHKLHYSWSTGRGGGIYRIIMSDGTR